MFEERVVDRPSSPRVHSTKGAVGRGCVPTDSLETRATSVPCTYTHVRGVHVCARMCSSHALTHALEGLQGLVSPAQAKIRTRSKRRCNGRSDASR